HVGNRRVLDDVADVADQVAEVRRVPHEPVRPAGLDAAIRRDDAERASERAEARERDQQAGELDSLAGAVWKAAVRGARKQPGQAADRGREPRDRPRPELMRRAPGEEEAGGPPVEKRDAE